MRWHAFGTDVDSIATNSSSALPNPPPQTHKTQEGAEGGGGGGGIRGLGYTLSEPELQVVGTTRSGRAVKSAAPMPPPRPPAAKKLKTAKQQQQQQEEEEAKEEQEGAAGVIGDGTAVDTEGKDANDWVCGICDELERSDKDRLVLCDGPCRGAFHQSCLGLSSEEVDAMAEWFCEQCTEGEHTVRFGRSLLVMMGSARIPSLLPTYLPT